MSGIKKEVALDSLNFNPFNVIGSNWELLAAGTPEKFNAMTVSWGSVGVLWNKNICTVYVRPQRYTAEFMDTCEYFSVSAFNGEDNHKEALTVFGTKSGRDIDKISKTGLTPAFHNNIPYFTEAGIIFICKKIYTSEIEPSLFIDPSIEKNYPNKDYHKVYIGEITAVLN